MCAYGLEWVLMGPHRSSFVLTDSNGYLWVLIGPYLSIWILMGPYGSL